MFFFNEKVCHVKASFQSCLIRRVILHWDFWSHMHIHALYQHMEPQLGIHEVVDGVTSLQGLYSRLRSREMALLSSVLGAVCIFPLDWWNDLPHLSSLVFKICTLIAKSYTNFKDIATNACDTLNQKLIRSSGYYV